MAVYTRGVAYVASGAEDKILEDLNTVIRKDGATTAVKEMASSELKCVEKRRSVRSKENKQQACQSARLRPAI